MLFASAETNKATAKIRETEMILENIAWFGVERVRDVIFVLPEVLLLLFLRRCDEIGCAAE